MPNINFEAEIIHINSLNLIHLPLSASIELPSRGMVMVQGTMNGLKFQAALEPDGKKSHWLKLDETLQKNIKAKVGDTLSLDIEPAKEWPEPVVSADITNALQNDEEAHSLWTKITPMARWDWIRWINSTAQPETRKRRIEVTCSKLRAGSRRPCCFNRSECTDPSVAKNGVLLEPINP